MGHAVFAAVLGLAQLTLARGSCFLQGMSYMDPSVSSTVPNGAYMANVELCQSACAANVDCHYFSWYAKTGGCFLLGANAHLISNGGVVSGPKVCPTPEVSENSTGPGAEVLNQTADYAKAVEKVQNLAKVMQQTSKDPTVQANAEKVLLAAAAGQLPDRATVNSVLNAATENLDLKEAEKLQVAITVDDLNLIGKERVNFELSAFEQVLKKWGVKVDNVVELFDHIDVDWNGSISVEELLNVLDSPLEDIQRRERQRQRQEVKRIFEELARSICEKFGSIEDAFAKHGLHGTGSSLSLAQFGKLAKQLDIELEAGVMQRVFNEIDEDRTGSISVQELQKALMYHIVSYVVVEIAHFLEQKGGLVEAFASLGEISSVLPPAPSTPGAPKPPPRLPGEEGVSEEKFLRVLRQLKVLDHITESAAQMIYAGLKPFTMEDFVRRLQEEHSLASELKRRLQEDSERHEKERKRRLAKSLQIDSKERAAKDIDAWLEKASAARETAPVTQRWAFLARAGTSKAQLRDYASVLEGHIQANSEAIQALQRQLGSESAPKFLAEPSVSDKAYLLKPTPSSPVVAPVVAPVVPLAPLRLDEATMHPEHRTLLAERLLQAAALGQASTVQRCLTSRADINAVAWGGVTALMSAAHHGQTQVADLLLKSAADPVRTDLLGRTALDHARRQPAYVQEWLRGHGVLGREELEQLVQALGRKLLETRQEWKRLQAMRDTIPSEDVLRHKKLMNRLGPRAISHLEAGTPGVSEPQPYSPSLLQGGVLGRSVSYPPRSPSKEAQEAHLLPETERLVQVLVIELRMFNEAMLRLAILPLAAALKRLDNSEMKDERCNEFACGRSPESSGWVAKMGGATLPGASNEACCERTCALFMCGPGYLPNKAGRHRFALLADAKSQDDCEKHYYKFDTASKTKVECSYDAKLQICRNRGNETTGCGLASFRVILTDGAPEISEKELNSTVNAFITRDRSIHDVTRALHKGKESLGKDDGLAAGAVTNAVATIKEVLTFRLQESAVDSIIRGKNKAQSPRRLKHFSSSLTDIEGSGYLEGEVDFGDFRRLWENLQGKMEGERGKVAEKIPWLLEQLKKGPTGQLTEGTLASMAGNLLKAMQHNPKVSQKFVQLGGVDVLHHVLCGDKEATVLLQTPFHPELQVVLCLLLAEVVLMGDAEVMAKRSQRKMAMNFFTKGSLNARMGALAKMSKHSAKSEQAVETLASALDGATRRHEHALVWGGLYAVGMLVHSASCCQQLFSSGYIPLLQRVLEVYEGYAHLPRALPRIDARNREVTKSVPSFISTQKPSATAKNPETLKEWWLRREPPRQASAPELFPMPGRARRRSSLEWLSVSRAKDGSDACRILEMAQSSQASQASAGGGVSFAAAQGIDVRVGGPGDAQFLASPSQHDSWLRFNHQALNQTKKRLKGKVFVYPVPPCASEVLTSPGDGAVGLDQEANALYLRKAAAQLGPLHAQLMARIWRTEDPEEAELFYIPAFFSLLFWRGDYEALQCVVRTFAELSGRFDVFGRRNGTDHVVLYGLEYQHYRSSHGFRLEDYHAAAANWIVLTVACPWPCGDEPDSWSLRSRFVLIPHGSRLRCRARRLSWASEMNSPRRFRLGYVGAVSRKFEERQAFFNLTCRSQRWLRTEDGVWHASAPWTTRHYVLDGNTTLLDAFLLTEESFKRCQAEPPDYGAYFRKSFSVPFYSFSDGTLAKRLDVIYGRAPAAEVSTGDLQALRREQPIFNSLLFETIYSHSEVCLILQGDTADGTKRLWDAVTRGCLPAFASSTFAWPLLPFPDQANSSSRALEVLLLLARLPRFLLARKRRALLQWLPLLVTESACNGTGQRHSVDLAMDEVWRRSQNIRAEAADGGKKCSPWNLRISKGP
ncbi:unnamed protein product, partial [Effrenium voratum]